MEPGFEQGSDRLAGAEAIAFVFEVEAEAARARDRSRRPVALVRLRHCMPVRPTTIRRLPSSVCEVAAEGAVEVVALRGRSASLTMTSAIMPKLPSIASATSFSASAPAGLRRSVAGAFRRRAVPVAIIWPLMKSQAGKTWLTTSGRTVGPVM
jgi:hypothetical protein